MRDYLFLDIKPTSREIIEACIDSFEVSRIKFATECREQPVARARWAAMSIIREMGRTYPWIASRFGMDHSSIVHGVARAEQLLRDPKEHAFQTKYNIARLKLRLPSRVPA